MSATPDSTSTDPEQRIADLERQLAEREAERDQGLQRETARIGIAVLVLTRSLDALRTGGS